MEHTPIAESDPKGELIKWLLANLTVSPVEETSMVNISFDSSNKSLAAMVANAVAEAYIETNLKHRLDSSTEASDWLKQQLEKSQQSVVESVEALQRYREEVGLLDMDGVQSVYAEQLRIVASEITAAHRVRLEAENLYKRATNLKGTGQMDSLPVVFNNPWIERLRQEEEQLERQIELDDSRFQGDYPGSSEARQKLNTLKIQIKSAVNQVIDGLKTDYELAVSREKQIKEKLKELEDKVQKLNAKEFHAQALEQVVLRNRQSYDAFLSNLMETTTRGSDTVSLIARIVDSATPAKIPYKPQKNS